MLGRNPHEALAALAALAGEIDHRVNQRIFRSRGALEPAVEAAAILGLVEQIAKPLLRARRHRRREELAAVARGVDRLEPAIASFERYVGGTLTSRPLVQAVHVVIVLFLVSPGSAPVSFARKRRS